MNKARRVRLQKVGCSLCARHPQHIPYGQKRMVGFCHGCDCGAEKNISKKAERHRAALAIKKEREK